MTVGMMWFDNSKAALEEKIRKAAEYYRAKYGQAANVVMVSLAENGEGPEGVDVRKSRYIRPGYLWVGVELRQ